MATSLRRSPLFLRGVSNLPPRARFFTLHMQIARLGAGDTPSPSAVGANAAADANPSPDAEGYEDWIKARAAAVGVPVALEKERQARCVFAQAFVS